MMPEPLACADLWSSVCSADTDICALYSIASAQLITSLRGGMPSTVLFPCTRQLGRGVNLVGKPTAHGPIIFFPLRLSSISSASKNDTACSFSASSLA